MSVKPAVLDKITEIAERVASSAGLEVVEVQLLGGGKHRMLRIYIDKALEHVEPGAIEGVTLEDCEKVSHQVSEILDAEDAIPGGGYTLEVSSPGVERKLAREQDWKRFTGHKVKVILKEPLEKQKVLVGRLDAFEVGDIAITLDPRKQGEGGTQVHFPLTQVDRANLKFEW